ncbi:MAG TPA: hypothetical protein VFG51_00025 [Candidatus Saccharimonadia bacterium]|nr:hypothetical protein [Candidatus Saccharimonadia bacterium]
MSELVTMTDPNMNAATPGDSVVMPTSSDSGKVDMKMGSKGSMRFFLPMVIVAIVAGIGTGYVLSNKMTLSAMKKTDTTTGGTTTDSAAQITAQEGKTYGSTDASTFKDSAEGVLVAGGVNGEGSHHIVREGGESQNVYLTSSVVDLNMFEGAKVLVRGETFQAQKAGWLMDVGQVKVEQLNAPLPDWAQKAADKAQQSSGANANF